MRFENILHIYWTKGIFISGKFHYFDTKLNQIFSSTYGAGGSLKNLIRTRFEVSEEACVSKNSVVEIEERYKTFLSKPLNIMMSQLFSVNNNPLYLVRLRIISQFLNKTYRGKCHAVVNLKLTLSGDLPSCDFFFMFDIKSLSNVLFLNAVHALDQVLCPLVGLPTA